LDHTGYVEVLVDFDTTITDEDSLEQYLVECSQYFQDAGFNVQCAAVSPGSVRVTLVGSDADELSEAIAWVENQGIVSFPSFGEADVNPNCLQCEIAQCEEGCLYCITTPTTCKECGTASCIQCEAPSESLDDACPSNLSTEDMIACLKERLAYDKMVAETCEQLQQSSQSNCEASYSTLESALSACDRR